MKKLTFHKQLILGLWIYFVCFILAALTGVGFFHNVGFITTGLLFILNPVGPPLRELQPTAKREVQIAGAVLIIGALLIRFGA